MSAAISKIDEEISILKETEVSIHYFSTKRMEHMVIESCEADLAIIINAVAYYGEAMQRYMEAHADSITVCGKYHIQSQLTRTKNVQKYLEEQTGYIRAEALERCRKRSSSSQDTGGDAFELAAGKRNAGRSRGLLNIKSGSFYMGRRI